MATSPIFIGTYKSPQLSLVAGYGAQPRPLFTAGSAGSRLHSLRVSGSNTSQLQLDIILAESVTLQTNMGTGAFVDGGGSSDTITRTVGSFVTDGWRVGERFVITGATTLANDFLATLTTVASGTLTFATGTVNTPENLPADSKIYRAARLATILLPSNAGTSGSPALQLLDRRYMPWLCEDPDGLFLILGAGKSLFFKLSAAVGSGEQVDITGEYGDY